MSMKKPYCEPVMEIEELKAEDVIVTSGTLGVSMTSMMETPFDRISAYSATPRSVQDTSPDTDWVELPKGEVEVW